jgi:hypothetical protein
MLKLDTGFLRDVFQLRDLSILADSALGPSRWRNWWGMAALGKTEG